MELATSPQDAQFAYLNRSLVNLRLGRTEKALQDACALDEVLAPTEKSLFRQARALYELQLYRMCSEKLEALLQQFPDNAAAKLETKKVKARISEAQYGKYNFKLINKQAEKTPPLIDCATFSKNVEIRPSPGRGRGLFTTKAVAAGEILLCEKAFAYSLCNYHDNEARTFLINPYTQTGILGRHANLVADVVQKIYHNPEQGQHIFDLASGAKFRDAELGTVDSAAVVDT